MLQSKLLTQFVEINHGLCTDVRDELQNVKIKEYEVNQVHGNSIIEIPSEYKEEVKADGMISNQNVRLSVKTADCLPIIAYAPNKNYISILHAGWKGLHLGIISEFFKKIKGKYILPKEVFIAIGPHVGPCCYTVPVSRVDAFLTQGVSKDIAYFKSNEWHLDIGKIAVHQCINAGVLLNQLDIWQDCTCCNKKFQSYRRDGVEARRMTSFIERKI